MKLVQSIISALGLMFLVAVFGLVLNTTKLKNISDFHDRIDAEWMELKSLVEFQITLNDLINYTSFHQLVQTIRPDTLLKKIKDTEEDLDAVREDIQKTNRFLQEKGLALDPSEQNTFEALKREYQGYEKQTRDLISNRGTLEASEINRSLSRLVDVQSKAFSLQLVHVRGVQAALSKAQAVNDSIQKQTVFITVFIVLLLAFISVFSVVLLKQRTAQSLEHQNLVTIGNLTHRLIHEIRNPLGIIKSSASVLKHESTDLEMKKELIHYMQDEIDRIDSILVHLRSLTDKGEISLSPVKPSVVIHKVIALLEGKCKEAKVALKYQDNAPGGEIQSNPNLIQQLFINLLLNSIQASPANSDIEIQTRSNARDYIISIQDHGVGMTPEEIKRGFKAFYTTRESGMGLGLLLVKQIVDKHHGRVDIRSEKNKGTLVTVELPKG